MIEYVLNCQSKTLHKTVDRRIPESCNTDQITVKKVFTEPQRTYTSELGRISPVRPCKRCFPEGLP